MTDSSGSGTAGRGVTPPRGGHGEVAVAASSSPEGCPHVHQFEVADGQGPPQRAAARVGAVCPHHRAGELGTGRGWPPAAKSRTTSARRCRGRGTTSVAPAAVQCRRGATEDEPPVGDRPAGLDVVGGVRRPRAGPSPHRWARRGLAAVEQATYYQRPRTRSSWSFQSSRMAVTPWRGRRRPAPGTGCRPGERRRRPSSRSRDPGPPRCPADEVGEPESGLLDAALIVATRSSAASPALRGAGAPRPVATVSAQVDRPCTTRSRSRTAPRRPRRHTLGPQEQEGERVLAGELAARAGAAVRGALRSMLTW